MNNIEQLTRLIEEWAKDRGIMDKATPETQFRKLLEEANELGDGIFHREREEVKDGIGDCFVVLVILAKLYGFENIEECVAHAYSEISERTGTMIDGTFVKDR